MNELTNIEQNRLDSLEDTISKGMKSFYAVGHALSEIREKRLYRSQYDTFEDYCRDRWQFTASRGRQLMAAVEAIASLPESAPKPANASQASALAEIDEDIREDVWDAARSNAESEGRSVTARDIREAADEHFSDQTGVIDAEFETLGDTNRGTADLAFKLALDAIKEAQDAAEALIKTSAKAWLLTSGSALLKHLRDARDHVRGAKPAGICPSCEGVGCSKCLETGWVNKTRMDALKK
jgi:hypothetical protein